MKRALQRLANRLFTKRSARRRERGLTLLEIMIVIAILGLVMGLVVVPRVMDMFGKSKKDIASLAINQFVHDIYPKWSLSNPGKPCPPDLLTLAQFIGKSEKDTKDPWDQPYKMMCGTSLPAGVKTSIAVMSTGEDMKEGTEDDIKSWE
jgi:general secretion pathway protein G